MFRFLMLTLCFILVLSSLAHLSLAQCVKDNGCHFYGNGEVYQCHCTDGDDANDVGDRCDGTTGECPTGCADGWFGPGCQYGNTSYTLDGTSTWLTDNNDNTCNPDNTQSITVTLDSSILLTWMRLKIQSSVADNGIQVTYIAGDVTTLCPVDQVSRVDTTTLDISCPTSGMVSELTLSGSGVGGLCSLYISAGRNIALKQTGYAQSTYGGQVAGNGVDGYLPSSTGVAYCTNTASGLAGQEPASWTLTFDGLVNINKIDIHNRYKDQAPSLLYYLNGFTLKLYDESNNVIYDYTDPTDATDTTGALFYYITDIGATNVKKVEVVLADNSPDNILIVCEVVVYGECVDGFTGDDCKTPCPEGTYGAGCMLTCSDYCGGSGHCDNVDGSCDNGCINSRDPPLCDECPQGTYGAGCDLTCSDNCGGDGYCNHVDGACDQGCKDGYLGDLCDQQCPERKYGAGCSQTCSVNCDGNGFCNHVDGACDQGCKDGYVGDLCDQQCSEGNYGAGCTQTCNINCGGDDGYCNHVSGSCDQGCKDGYQGAKCDQQCPEGNYGAGCLQTCSLNCGGDDGYCNHVDGSCDQGCKDGYQGDLCDQKCPEGKYGAGCLQTCSLNCGDGGNCNHVDGSCDQGCKDGYQGSLCNQQCPEGKYGAGCTKNCNDNCGGDGSCNREDGACSQFCKAGYVGELCDEECTEGKYGAGCGETCSTNCGGDGYCNYVNGSCDQGCKDGYVGDLCDQACPQGKYGAGCGETCSINCGGDGYCNHTNGLCDEECKDGYNDTLCNQACYQGTYGAECGQTCSIYCGGNGYCNHVTGSCDQGCETGYQGLLCDQTCSQGKYGAECRETCSANCGGDGYCNHVNGSCDQGCKEGYNGTLCEQQIVGPSDGDDSSTIIIAAVGASVGVLVIIAVIAGIFLCRRRGKSEEPAPSPKSKQKSIRDLSAQSKEETDHYHEIVDVSSASSETAIPVSTLKAYLVKHASDTFFDDQFQSVPETFEEFKTTHASMEENKKKNRFQNIWPYDRSRVVLSIKAGKPNSDYINATHITSFNNSRSIIASQGPNDTTMNDFMRMLWEQGVDKIVMLTNLVEKGKRKCNQYWPVEGVETFGDISVKLLTTRVYAEYTIRSLSLSRGGEAKRDLTQYHFTTWPDKSVPESPWGLVDLYHRVMDGAGSGTLLVHCSAGVGRTGTFIAIHHLLKEAEATGKMDFLQTLKRLRADRTQMVQTKIQYSFLHLAALAAHMTKDSIVPVRQMADKLRALYAQSGGSRRGLASDSGFNKEFAVAQLCVDLEETDVPEDDGVYANSKASMNKLKNRLSNILPNENYRVSLSDDNVKGEIYINAVWVPNFTHDRHDLLTQLPLPNTVTDFWRLVVDYQVSLMVVFDTDIAQADETIGAFLPLKISEVIKDNVFEITLNQREDSRYWQELKVSVGKSQQTSKAHKKPRAVKCLLIKETKLDPGSWLEIVTKVKASRPPEASRSLYMCRNGATYSGLACVQSILLDRLEVDQCLAVPLVVGTIKAIRPQVIPTVEQYKLLYEVLKQAQEASNVYGNVNNRPVVIPIKRGSESAYSMARPTTESAHYSVLQPGDEASYYSVPRPASSNPALQSSGHVYGNIQGVESQMASAANPPQPAKRSTREREPQETNTPSKPVPAAKPSRYHGDDGNKSGKVGTASAPPNPTNPFYTNGELRPPSSDAMPMPNNEYGNIGDIVKL